MSELALTFYVYKEDKENSEIVSLFATDRPYLQDNSFKIWHDLLPAIESIASIRNFPKIIVCKTDLDLEKPQIIVLFVKSEDLTSRSSLLDTLAKLPLRYAVAPENKNEADQPLKPEPPYHPIITIGYPDITYLHSEDKDDQRQQDWTAMLKDSLDLDKRFKFLDSSIWHRYVSVMPYDDAFENVLQDVLNDIISYHEDNLYQTNAAVISLEFQVRMLLHSYVAKFGFGGHSEMVTPFKFHSERQMRINADKEIKFFHQDWGGNTLLKALQWRMLLVDDQANTLSLLDKDKQNKFGKKDLLLKPLKALYDLVDWEIRKPIKFAHPGDPDTPTTLDRSTAAHIETLEVKDLKHHDNVISFAKEQLCKNNYDIIFLDYLLGYNTKESKREYGPEFLQELLKENRDSSVSDNQDGTASGSYRRDLSGRYWIFPISSYPYALLDKLTQLGISHLQEIWHIAQGGDPLSTPHLYTYNLFRFMKQRISEYFLHPTALRDLINQIPLTNESIENRLWAETTLQSIENWEKKVKLLDKINFTKQSKGFSWSVRTIIKDQRHQYLNDTLNNIKKILAFLSREIESINEEDIINRCLHILGVNDMKNGEKLISYPAINSDNNMLTYPEVLDLFKRKVTRVMHFNYNKAKRKINKIKDSGSTNLSLANMRIYKLPNEIQDLKDLEHLNLEGNYLTELPPAVKYLEKLISINLRKNQISKFPKELFALENLESINISHNKLSELPDFPEGAFKHLIYLNLHNNSLQFTKNETQVRELWQEIITNSENAPFRTTLYNLIQYNKLNEAMVRLIKYKAEWSSDIIQYQARHSLTETNFNNGLINYESYLLNINLIRKGITFYVDQVTD